MLGARFADNQWNVLILFKVAMKEGKLLLSMGGIIGGVHIQVDRRGQLAAMMLLQAFDAGGNEKINQALEHRRGGQVLKS